MVVCRTNAGVRSLTETNDSCEAVVHLFFLKAVKMLDSQCLF